MQLKKILWFWFILEVWQKGANVALGTILVKISILKGKGLNLQTEPLRMKL